MEQHSRNLRSLLEVHGFVRTLVLLVRFTDHSDRDSVPRQHLEQVFSGFGTDPHLYPTGSVRAFLEANSQNNYTQEFDVMEWAVTDNTETHYSFGSSGINQNIGYLMHPALDALEERGIDWSRYDLNGDGVIDNIVVLHSGHPAEIGQSDCYGNHYQQRIWSHRTLVSKV